MLGRLILLPFGYICPLRKKTAAVLVANVGKENMHSVNSLLCVFYKKENYLYKVEHFHSMFLQIDKYV